MEQPELEVREVPTGSLAPYANNAKLHSELQVEQIAASIKEFGFNDPVGVWENPRGGLEIVEGHGRVLAAERLGMGAVPVVRLDHLTDEQRRAYTHVHNQTTLSSGFDLEILDAELESLDFDWEAFGFSGAAAFDAIEDLMNEDFVAQSTAGEGETFNITFTFPADMRDEIEGYVKSMGKGEIAAQIAREAAQWA